MRNPLKTATYLGTLAWRHVRADPARAALRGLRLLPDRERRRCVAVTRTLYRIGILGPVPYIYCLWSMGHRERATALVHTATHSASPSRAARLAAFAIACEQDELAEALLDQVPAGRRRRRLAHRRDLAAGRVAAATSPPPRPVGGARVAPRSGTARDQRVNTSRGECVLHLVTNALPHTNAGYTQRTHRIARAQQAAGMRPHVLTQPGYPLSQGILDARPQVPVDGVPYHRLLPWIAPGNDAARLRLGLRLAEPLVLRLRPTVLHAASGHRNAELALALGRRHGIPVVYEVRGFLEESWLSRDPRRCPTDAHYRVERDRETACMQAADLVVTLGTAMRAEIVARGVPSEKIVIAPNAVDESFLEPLPDATELRAELGLGPDSVVVGTTTSCYGYEGLDTLLRAVALLRERGRDAHALIVGDGPELPALRELARGLPGGQHWAHLPGRVPAAQVRRYHAVLDVFAVPRRDQRVCRLVTPLKPVEAMAGGVPVVASDLPALREIVEPGVTGALIPPDDCVGLATCVEELLYRRTHGQELGQAARRWVRNGRTWTSLTKTYKSGYESLLWGKGGC
ncbi:glycosyltransferase family 4 protein [Lipingzhangella sp. LS1_29]|uniref:Glycosyltransferase family 4 protein n=1 Tax=Lipingzhangella rawalii TaxID=2055835 RepID=A0ABU2H4F2_9ACTN|nr:glycosyltransferase family 4 protein [Lipingzhangella rawalii]MDS1269730.1 glycosyltransferase family 4 protein [Lipingzhangella rawalii]